MISRMRILDAVSAVNAETDRPASVDVLQTRLRCRATDLVRPVLDAVSDGHLDCQPGPRGGWWITEKGGDWMDENAPVAVPEAAMAVHGRAAL
jgi:hypothetical protein